MSAATLTERVRELAALRAEAQASVAALKARREAFDLENAALIQLSKDSAFKALEAETALKAVAAEEFERTGVKKPAPGVEIKLFKDYTINEEQALTWAKEKDLCLIPAKLDVAAIKKLATVQALPFVLVEDLPKVQIATDLEKALAVQQLSEAGTETALAR